MKAAKVPQTSSSYATLLLNSGVSVISGYNVLASPRDGAMRVPWVYIHLTTLIEQLLRIKIHTHVLTSLSLMAPLL